MDDFSVEKDFKIDIDITVKAPKFGRVGLIVQRDNLNRSPIPGYPGNQKDAKACGDPAGENQKNLETPIHLAKASAMAHFQKDDFELKFLLKLIASFWCLFHGSGA